MAGLTKRSRVLGVLLATALVAAGCASGGGGGEESAAKPAFDENEFGAINVAEETGKPVDGGTLTFADYSEARSLDPTQTIATGASGGSAIAAVYDTLTRVTLEGEVEPWLAESVEADEDFTTWTVTLREGVTFSDGTPLDAQAVVGSYEYYTGNGGSDAALLTSNVTSVTAQGKDTVVFELNGSWSTFGHMLAQGVGMIVAPAAIAGKEFEPIGAGPFELESYRPNEELVLAANEDYWKGEPHLDTLRFIWMGSPQATLDTLATGQADVAYFQHPETAAEAARKGFSAHRTLVSMAPKLLINHRQGRPGADPRVRKAIAYAIDTATYDQRVDNGMGMPGQAMFGPNSRWHTDVEPIEVDREKAKQLVAEAKADGFDGKLTYFDGSDPRSQNEAVAFEAMLEAVGFEVEADLADSVATQIERMYIKHDFDIATSASSVSEADPFHRLVAALHSESRLNASGYASKEMDALLQQLQGAPDDDARREVIAEIEELWKQDVPGVVLGAQANLVAWNDDVHGVVPTAEYMTLFGEAWLSE